MTTNQKVVGSNPAGLTMKEVSKETSFSFVFKASSRFFKEFYGFFKALKSVPLSSFLYRYYYLTTTKIRRIL